MAYLTKKDTKKALDHLVSSFYSIEELRIKSDRLYSKLQELCAKGNETEAIKCKKWLNITDEAIYIKTMFY